MSFFDLSFDPGYSPTSPTSPTLDKKKKTLTPKKNSGAGDSKPKTAPKVARDHARALMTSQKAANPEEGAKTEMISSLIGTLIESSVMLASPSTPSEASVSLGNDSIPSPPAQKKMKNAVSSSSCPPSSSRGLSAIIEEMIEVHDSRIMASLSDLESHHKKGEEIINRARIIAQEVKNYEEKLKATKAM